jgi:hypothetical protein
MRWKIFAVAWLAFLIDALATAILNLSKLDPFHIADIAVWVVAVIGLFGYAFEVALLPARFWRPFSRAFACWSLLEVCLITYWLSNPTSSLHTDPNFARMFPAMLPAMLFFFAVVCVIPTYFLLKGVWRYAEMRASGRPFDRTPAQLGRQSLAKLAGLFSPRFPALRRRLRPSLMRWKMFAVVCALWMFNAVLLTLADWSHIRAYDAVDLAFWILATTGLFGYAFELALAPAAIWRPFSRAFAWWLLFSASASLLHVLSLTQADANEDAVLARFGLPLTYAIDCLALIAVGRYSDKRASGRPLVQEPARYGGGLLAKLASSSLGPSLYGSMAPGDQGPRAIVAAWKLLALCFCYFVAFEDIDTLADLANLRFAGGVGVAFLNMAAVGLVGYAFRLQLLPWVIWRPFAVGFTCWLCTMSLRLWLTRSGILAQPGVVKWGMLVTILAFGFLLIAVWRYAVMRTAGRQPSMLVAPSDSPA